MSDSQNQHLLMMSSDEVNLQTQRNQYGSTPEALPPINPLTLIPLIRRYVYLHLHSMVLPKHLVSHFAVSTKTPMRGLRLTIALSMI